MHKWNTRVPLVGLATQPLSLPLPFLASESHMLCVASNIGQYLAPGQYICTQAIYSVLCHGSIQYGIYCTGGSFDTPTQLDTMDLYHDEDSI